MEEINELEKLLNILLLYWCNFFNKSYVKCIVEDSFHIDFYRYHTDSTLYDTYSINDICSIQSWLCNFIATKQIHDLPIYINNIDEKWNFTRLLPLNWYQDNSEQYWLMILAVQENKRDFLVYNLKLNRYFYWW